MKKKFKERKSFFDDRVYYSPKKDQIYMGRPDTRAGNGPWEFWITDLKECFRPLGPPKDMIELGREYEMTLCRSQND